MDITVLENGTKVINDAYNANCESMLASLKILREYKENRKIAILGDMLNLGEFSEELHRKIGNEVVQDKIDILIYQGEEAKFIAEEAINKGMAKDKIYKANKKEDIIEILEEINKPEDVILFKASNAMKFYEMAEKFIK